MKLSFTPMDVLKYIGEPPEDGSEPPDPVITINGKDVDIYQLQMEAGVPPDTLLQLKVEVFDPSTGKTLIKNGTIPKRVGTIYTERDKLGAAATALPMISRSTLEELVEFFGVRAPSIERPTGVIP